MVLISRFISCSRKSSLRPHGSGAVTERVPVHEMRPEARDLLADVRSAPRCARSPAPASRDRPARRRRARARARGASLRASVRPSAAASARPSISVCEERTARREVGPQLRPFVRPHAIQVGQRLVHGILHRVEQSTPEAAPRSPRPSRIESAWGSRRRSPGVSRPSMSPCSRAWARAALQRAERTRRSTPPAAPPAGRGCRLTLTSMRPRATCRCTAARRAGSRSLRLAGARSCRSR